MSGAIPDDEALTAALAAMRVEYEAELPAILDTLAALVEDAAARPESAQPALRAAHTLRGTAGTYGLVALGQAAGRIEDAIEDGAPAGELRALLAAVLALKP